MDYKKSWENVVIYLITITINNVITLRIFLLLDECCEKGVAEVRPHSSCGRITLLFTRQD